MNCSPCSNRLNTSGQSGRATRSTHDLNSCLCGSRSAEPDGRSIPKSFRDEIFILGHKHRIFVARMFPNRFVLGSLQTDVENVRRFVSSGRNPLCEHRRKLSVNEKRHVGCKTAWSACRAA